MSKNYIDSYYTSSINQSVKCDALNADMNCDVCIIGAGSTGLSSALELAKSGYDVVVLEANKIGWGASSRSGGQAGVNISKGVKYIKKYVGEDSAKAVFDMSVEALNIIRQNCQHYNIDCDIKPGVGGVAMNKSQDIELLQKCQDYADYGYDLNWWDKDKTQTMIASAKYTSAYNDPNAFHMHSLNYVLGLAKACQSLGVRIFENARMHSYSNDNLVFKAKTDRATISAKYGVFATNAYLNHNEAPKLAKRIIPVGTYIIATEPLGKQKALDLIKNDMAIYDMGLMLHYYRFSKDYRLLFGGGATYAINPHHKYSKLLYHNMLDIFPQLCGVKIDQTWGGYCDTTMSQHPDFGWLDTNIVYAQGFAGHGIALTNIAGHIMAEAITGKSGRLDLFTRIKHIPFIGGKWLQKPAFNLGLAWFKLLELIKN